MIFWQLFPDPIEDKLPEYYKSENYISHTDSKTGFFDKIYQQGKIPNASEED